ncbi:phosphomannomutase/phosphoglucomutase [Pseudomonas sp. PDM16]|nr:phosphomannomutase/phosphoglucomutase [Pseudomonas sp. PDM16]
MKLLKRTAKDNDQSLTAPAAKPARQTGNDQKALVPGVIAAMVGLTLAGALIAFNFNDSSKQHQKQLIDAWGSSQASALNQAQLQLQADTQAAAKNPALLAALQSGDRNLVTAAERSLQHWEGVVDAHLNLPRRAALDIGRTGPMNFAALDMLQRLENGQKPAVEAYKAGERWLAYSAAPIFSPGSEQIQGTLLLVVDLQRLLAALPALPEGIGQVQLNQKFSTTPAQTLMTRGTGAGTAQSFETGNPNWQLDFTPGQALSGMPMSPIILGIAGLLALAGALIGLMLTRNHLLGRLRGDVQQLAAMLQELSSGKSVKAFSLHFTALDGLAQSLARLPRPKKEASRPEPGSPTGSIAPTGSKPTQLADPMFQATDILDIDILDEDQDLLGLEQPFMDSAVLNNQTPPKLPATIFRAYDIRGVVGDTLTPEAAYWIGRAIGSESLAQGEPNVAVGRDGRLSGPQLVQQLIQGLLDCGCQVTDIGMVPTPVLYFATHVLEGKSGVMLTGSHNPPDYNGFKIVIAGDTQANEQIQALKTRIDNNDLATGVGSVEQIDILDRYFKQIRDDIAMAKPIKVVVDCGNGVAGVIAPRLIEALGCSVIPLYCEVDGNFPNHHPDPGKPENLKDLIARVKSEGADLGLAFDGDGDRVGVVTNTGTIVYPDRLMMLFAKDVVSRNPGADIIYDVKCTRRLGALISGYGGRPVMWKTGHSLIKKKMKETGALLAGEMSGHVFFKERWFGFDDGIYSAARLLEILSQDRRDAEHVFSAFPLDISTPELNITVTDENKFRLVDRLQRDGVWGEANLTTLDGVRVDYPKGWGLVRASNTTPVLVLRFEAETEEELKRIKEVFRAQLYNVAPDLNLPF